MLRLVAYDIADEKRLRKVARHCEGYGFRVEFSVFECNLNEKLFDEFWGKLREVVNEDEDRVVAYKVCAECVKSIRSMGDVNRPRNVDLYII